MSFRGEHIIDSAASLGKGAEPSMRKLPAGK